MTAGRSAGDWLREARGFGSGASASHRAQALATDALVRIVADPQHSEAERVAAAVAWLERGDADAHERVRITARATASEPLRRALEAAAERDEEALLEAAAALDGSAATKRR